MTADDPEAGWENLTRAQKARLLWEGYRHEYTYVALLLPFMALFMLAAAALQWHRGIHDVAVADLSAAVAFVIAVWLQVDLSAARITVRDLDAQLDALEHTEEHPDGP